MDLAEVDAAAERLEKSLSAIGLYAGEKVVQEGPDGRVYVVLDAVVGDLAFTARVQHPEQHDIDAEFRKMTFGADGDQFLDARADLERRIANGTLGDD